MTKKNLNLKFNPTLKFDEKLKQILVGGLLGDFSLRSYNGKTWSLNLLQSTKNKEYLLHVFEFFSFWVKTLPANNDEITPSGKIYSKMYFNTVKITELNEIGLLWYKLEKKVNKNNNLYLKHTKILPSEIYLQKYLTPLALAHWFMCDGSARHGPGVFEISSEGFTLLEVNLLIKILYEKYNIKANPQVKNRGFRIYITKKSALSFQKCIEPFIIPSMRYKLIEQYF